MAIEDGDFRLRFKCYNSQYNEMYHNTWYFKATTGTWGAANLLNAFVTDFVPAMETILPTNCNSAGITVESLFDPDDYAEDLTVGFAGGLTPGELMPRWTGWAFELIRGTRQNKRQGRKFFGPIPEANVANGLATAGSLTLLNAAASVFGSALITGLVNYYVALPRSIKVDAPELKLKYKYVIQDLFAVADVIYKRVSTQNTHPK